MLLQVSPGRSRSPSPVPSGWPLHVPGSINKQRRRPSPTTRPPYLPGAQAQDRYLFHASEGRLRLLRESRGETPWRTSARRAALAVVRRRRPPPPPVGTPLSSEHVGRWEAVCSRYELWPWRVLVCYLRAGRARHPERSRAQADRLGSRRSQCW